MLCSDDPGSDWLHRLRASKGFPAESAPDLERFISSSPNDNPGLQDSQTPKPIPSTADCKSSLLSKRNTASSAPRSTSRNKDDLFNVMSTVLADLFVMGEGCWDSSNTGNFKSSRKQAKPKMCAISSSVSVQDSCLAGAPIPSMSPSSADNSVAEAKDARMHGNEVVDAEEEISKTVGAGADLGSFSRTVFTIIDTSSPIWKSKKVLLRKGTVWKIRDKKRISITSSGKKRIVNQHEESGGRKKQRKDGNPLLSPEVNPGDQSQEKHLLLSEKTRSGSKEAFTNLKDDKGHSKKRRPQFSRSPRKEANKDTSVFHIKCIPTSEKSGVRQSNKRPRDVQ